MDSVASSVHKTCAKCGQDKPIETFSRRRGQPTNRCKACALAYLETWRRAHPDNLAAHAAQRAEKRRRMIAENPELAERERVATASRRAANPEQARVIGRRSAHTDYVKNRELRKEQVRAYRRDKADAVRTSKRTHYLAHREEFYARNHVRRCRLANCPGSHTAAEWEALKASYLYRCLACARQEPTIQLTRDHVVPVAQGGSNDIDNIQPLCKSCNSKKHDKAIDYRPA